MTAKKSSKPFPLLLLWISCVVFLVTGYFWITALCFGGCGNTGPSERQVLIIGYIALLSLGTAVVGVISRTMQQLNSGEEDNSFFSPKPSSRATKSRPRMKLNKR